MLLILVTLIHLTFAKWQKTYDWVAVNQQIVCQEGKKCYGWEMFGQYTVTTDEKLRHKVDLTATIVNPKKWSEGGIYGIAFNFPFLPSGQLPTPNATENHVE